MARRLAALRPRDPLPPLPATTVLPAALWLTVVHLNVPRACARARFQTVAYELALAEAAAHYSGTGNDQVFYLDAAYSMSQLGGDLKPGLDCPAEAAFLDGTLWVNTDEASGELNADVSEARPYKARVPPPHRHHCPTALHHRRDASFRTTVGAP